MNWIDVVALVVAVLALLVSGYNAYKYSRLTKEYNDMVETQTLTAQGAFEAQIRAMISDATKEVNSYAVQVAREPENEVLRNAYFVAEEMYRNAFEDACAKYIDGKIDRERFRKLYGVEIQKLVNDPEQGSYYATNQSVYASTVAVYKEWFAQA